MSTVSYWYKMTELKLCVKVCSRKQRSYLTSLQGNSTTDFSEFDKYFPGRGTRTEQLLFFLKQTIAQKILFIMEVIV